MPFVNQNMQYNLVPVFKCESVESVEKKKKVYSKTLIHSRTK